MGIVYEAHDTELDRRVAIKVVRAAVGGTGLERRSERLLLEARTLAKLSHRNVVAVYDVGVFEDTVFVAMAYVDGSSLAQWMRASDRSWRETVAMFIEVGEGLAAVHRLGLVHRDFKPSNVLIDSHGCPQLSDFGLAKRASGSTALTGERAEPAASGAVEESLTLEGRGVGTPAYMSPEQRRGEAVDARSDQYSFCVALRESLCSARFPGGGVQGDRIPRARTIPPALRTVLARGLAAAAENRWPSMDALLSELTRMLARRRWLWASAALVVAALINVAVLKTIGRDPENAAAVNDHLQARVAEIWSAPRRTAIQARVAAAHPELAAELWPRIGPELDAYAGAWIEASMRAREAHWRGDRSELRFDSELRCLDLRLADFASFVEVLETVDAAALADASRAIHRLPAISSCDEVAVLALERPRPHPAIVGRVVEIERDLAAQAVRLDFDPLADVAPRVERLLSQARALDYAPLIADALGRMTIIALYSGDYERARVLAEEGIQIALATHSDALALELLGHQIFIIGDRLRDTARALELLPVAEGLIARTGQTGKPVHAKIVMTVAMIHELAGSYERSFAEHRQAIELFERALGTDHVDVAMALNNYGVALMRAGDPAGAIAPSERAIEIWTRAFGPQQSDVLRARINLAGNLSLLGKPEPSVAILEDTCPRMQASLGERHPDSAGCLSVLGDALLAGGRVDEAEAVLRRAIAFWEETLGPKHQYLTYALHDLGRVHERRGELDLAIAAYERCMVIAREANVPLQWPLPLELGSLLWARPADRRRAVALMREVRGRPDTPAEMATKVEAWFTARPEIGVEY